MRFKIVSLIVLASMFLSVPVSGTAGEEDAQVPFLGVKIDDAESGGAKVTDIQPGSPAEKAGIAIGDVLTRWGGRDMDDSSDFMLNLYSQKPGETVTVTIVTNGTARNIQATLGTSDDEYADVYNNIPLIVELFRIEMMGYAVDELGIITGNLAQPLLEYFEVEQGVLVQYVEEGSNGAKKGFLPGDVIYEINGTPVPHTMQFRTEVDKSKKLIFKLKRKGKDITIDMRKKESKS